MLRLVLGATIAAEECDHAEAVDPDEQVRESINSLDDQDVVMTGVFRQVSTILNSER